MLKEYSFENIYIRHAIDNTPNDTDFTMHIHDKCEIYFFISGNVDYLVEGSVYPLEENCIMIMRPSEVHKPKIVGSKKYERYAINFPVDYFKDIDPMSRLTSAFTQRPLGKNNMLDSSTINMNALKAIFLEMFGEFKDNYDRELSIKAHLIMILDMIRGAYDKLEKSEPKPRSTAEKILAYVNNHLFDSITVPELASHFYLSSAQFNRIFRQTTGASPWEYITKKRLTAAKEKIHSGSSAYTACESCGFKDYSSFYRAFTKYFGCSPSNGRERL